MENKITFKEIVKWSVSIVVLGVFVYFMTTKNRSFKVSVDAEAQLDSTGVVIDTIKKDTTATVTVTK